MKLFTELRQALNESFYLSATDDKKISYNGDEPGTKAFRKDLNRWLAASDGEVTTKVMELARKKLKETDPTEAEFLDFLADVAKTKSKKIKPVPNRNDKKVWFASLL